MSLIGRDVTVIGAGVAGLTLARALALRGASVRVLEQAAEVAEVGAGLQISPNGGRVLQALGLGERLREISGQSEAVELRDARGARVLRMDLAGQGPFALVHRADLIAALLEGAEAAGVRVETGVTVTSVSTGADRPSLVTESGRREASLVVGADGLHSRVRAALLGEAAPQFTGQVAWRALVPLTAPVPQVAQVFMAPGRHLVAYPLRDGTLLNIVAVEERREWAAEGWHHAGDPDDLRAAFAGFGRPVPGWLAGVTEVKLWGLFRHEVAPRWFAPGAVLLGDAAHPTLPFLAQGACMALEDAYALARALAEHDTDEAAFAAYQAARRPRVNRIVEAANANARNYHLGGLARPVAHGVLRMVNAVAPGLMLRRFAWLYDFDVTA